MANNPYLDENLMQNSQTTFGPDENKNFIEKWDTSKDPNDGKIDDDKDIIIHDQNNDKIDDETSDLKHEIDVHKPDYGVKYDTFIEMSDLNCSQMIQLISIINNENPRLKKKDFKEMIVSYFKHNDINGVKLIKIGRAEFGNKIVAFANTKKIRGFANTLHAALIQCDLARHYDALIYANDDENDGVEPVLHTCNDEEELDDNKFSDEFNYVCIILKNKKEYVYKIINVKYICIFSLCGLVVLTK